MFIEHDDGGDGEPVQDDMTNIIDLFKKAA